MRLVAGRIEEQDAPGAGGRRRGVAAGEADLGLREGDVGAAGREPVRRASQDAARSGAPRRASARPRCSRLAARSGWSSRARRVARRAPAASPLSISRLPIFETAAAVAARAMRCAGRRAGPAPSPATGRASRPRANHVAASAGSRTRARRKAAAAGRSKPRGFGQGPDRAARHPAQGARPPAEALRPAPPRRDRARDPPGPRRPRAHRLARRTAGAGGRRPSRRRWPRAACRVRERRDAARSAGRSPGSADPAARRRRAGARSSSLRAAGSKALPAATCSGPCGSRRARP